MDAAHQSNTCFTCTSNGMFMDNHSDIFKKKAGDATQLHLDGTNQQAQSEHKSNVENVHIHGIVLQN